MLKLTSIQREVLSSAAAREDGAALAREGATPASIAKIGSGLVARKLAREVRAPADAPMWRQDKMKGPLSLVITSAGRKLLERLEAEQERSESPSAGIRPADAAPETDVATPGLNDASPAEPKPSATAPRATKQVLIFDLLKRVDGASLDELVAATSWQPHSARAALSGLRKRGMSVERIAGEDGGSRYRLVADGSKAS